MMQTGIVAHAHDQPTPMPSIDFQVGGHCGRNVTHHLNIISSENRSKKSAGKLGVEGIAGKADNPSVHDLYSKGET